MNLHTILGKVPDNKTQYAMIQGVITTLCIALIQYNTTVIIDIQYGMIDTIVQSLATLRILNNLRKHARHKTQAIGLLLILLSNMITPVSAVQDTTSQSNIIDTAAKLIGSAWLAFKQRTEPETNVHSMTPDTNYVGDPIRHREGVMNLTISNARGGIHQYDKLQAMKEISEKHESDIHIVSETGKHNHPKNLIFQASHLQANETTTQENRAFLTRKFRIHNNYIYCSSEGAHDHERGGILIMIKETWRHRIHGKPYVHPSKRWMAIQLHTPLEKMCLIAAYLPPNPQSNTEHLKLWKNLTQYVIKKRNQGFNVVLAGDLNASRNTEYTRHHSGGNHTVQNALIEALLNKGNLVDVYPYRHGDTTQYKTWIQTNNEDTWTSPDHIMISRRQGYRIAGVTIDYEPMQTHELDHATLNLALHIDESIRPPSQTRHKKIFIDPKKVESDYIPEIREQLRALKVTEQQLTPDEKAFTLFKIAIKVGEKLFGTTGHRSHRNTKVLKLWNDIKNINKMLYALKSGKAPPLGLLRTKIIRTTGTSSLQLKQKKRQLRNLINSKARKRSLITRRMFVKNRTNKFDIRKYGEFLTSALGKFTHFKGVQGVHMVDTGGISTNPNLTKEVATKRIRDTFFKERIPTPAYFTTPTIANWNKLPHWFRTVYHNVLQGKVHSMYDKILDPISTAQLKQGMKAMGRNKTGGPSGLTVEMLRDLPDDILQEWLLPFLNQALQTGNIPQFAKNFNVWCTEKTPGVGTIMHPTEKLQVRPISLFEVSAKILEGQLTYRLNKALQGEKHMSLAQYGFMWGKSVVEALLLYLFIIEDSQQFKKEIHISNNDCTQAYDAVPPWGMQATYAYHEFPPALSKLLMNMDQNRIGRVLTAHGAGKSWTKTCGLGQGSIISPLKWNLFLDPLLKAMEQTKDPYWIGSTPIYVVAFADDTTIVSSTHEGYVERMQMANEYFSFFGVEFSPAKTKYTFNNTNKTHESVKIRVRNNNGEFITQPTTIISSKEAIRYLGGWMNLHNTWKEAKTLLLEDLDKILSILKHKQTGWRGYKYVVQSVISAKLRYYLTIVPLTQHEVETVDQQIAMIMKRELRMAVSSSSPLLYMNSKKTMGLSLPSIQDIRDQSLIVHYHKLLNTDTILGKIANHRMRSLRTYLNWTECPSSYADRVPKHAHQWWMGRTMLAMKRLQVTVEDIHGMDKLPPKRKQDTPMFLALPANIFNSIHKELKQADITWVSDIASANGTKLRHSNTIHGKKEWWKTMQRYICLKGSNTLRQPVANTTPPIHTRIYKNKIGDIVTIPKQLDHPGAKPHTYYPHTHNGMYQITKVYWSGGREVCDLRELHKTFRKIQSIEQERQWCKVNTQGSSYYIKGNETAAQLQAEYANSVIQLPQNWVRAKSYRHNSTIIEQALLIHTDQFISTEQGTARGFVTDQQLQDLNAKFTSSFYMQGDECYSEEDEDDIGECEICDHVGNLMECSSKIRCKGWYHPQCGGLRTAPEEEWTCEKCAKTSRTEFRQQWTSSQLQQLMNMNRENLYSASDGWVSKRHTAKQVLVIRDSNNGR